MRVEMKKRGCVGSGESGWVRVRVRIRVKGVERFS